MTIETRNKLVMALVGCVSAAAFGGWWFSRSRTKEFGPGDMPRIVRGPVTAPVSNRQTPPPTARPSEGRRRPPADPSPPDGSGRRRPNPAERKPEKPSHPQAG